jgi:hypothetical protein
MPPPAPISSGSSTLTGIPKGAGLRRPRRAEDARSPAQVPRPGHRGNLGHRRCRGPVAGRDGPSRHPPWPARSAACFPSPAASPARTGR